MRTVVGASILCLFLTFGFGEDWPSISGTGGYTIKKEGLALKAKASEVFWHGMVPIIWAWGKVYPAQH